MIAAILDLDEGARVILEAGHEMRRRFLHGHDIGDANAGRIFVVAAKDEAFGLHFLVVAENAIHFRHGCELAGRNLGGAARHDDPGPGPLAPETPDGLAGLAFRLAGHGAGIDDNRVVQPRFPGKIAHDLGLVGIETSAKGNDLGSAHGVSVPA